MGLTVLPHCHIYRQGQQIESIPVRGFLALDFITMETHSRLLCDWLHISVKSTYLTPSPLYPHVNTTNTKTGVGEEAQQPARQAGGAQDPGLLSKRAALLAFVHSPSVHFLHGYQSVLGPSGQPVSQINLSASQSDKLVTLAAARVCVCLGRRPQNLRESQEPFIRWRRKKTVIMGPVSEMRLV